MKIVTIERMRSLEEASASLGTSTDTLMENAGLAAAREARNALGRVAGLPVLALVGPGNNGGDGLVVARHLQRWGANVTAYLLHREGTEDSKLTMAQDGGVAIISSAQDPELKALKAQLFRARLVVDAVLGTGQARPLEGTVREAMLHLSAARTRRPDLTVLALDLPTGMNADTGQVDPACPGADITITFGYPKAGHFRFPGAGMLGKLRVVDIDIPGHLAQDIVLELLTPGWVSDRLPPRPLSGHKGTFGHTLVIAGSGNYVGAAYLAAQGAARVGAGLVTLSTVQSIYPILASKLTEVLHLPLPDDGNGRLHPEAAGPIKKNLGQYTSILVGCGLGRSKGLEEFLRDLLLVEPRPSIPVVIDADALNNLSKIEGWWRDLDFPVVVTPHPGEMSTLTGVPTPNIQGRRTESALEWAARWQVVVVLKGAHTVIATPDGTCRVSPFANPGLASGGTGDVLTGIIAGLLAQGSSPEDAACCGVYLHAAAAETVQGEMGDTGTLAGDLLPVLPAVIAGIRQRRS